MPSSAWRPGQYVTDDRQAEQMAAHAMRTLGYPDARETPVGPDGGIDVRASGAIAQVKFRGGQTGRADIQRLVGAAGRHRDLQLLFFTASGYSTKAVEYAAQMDVALFSYTPTGVLTSHSPAAARRMHSASVQHPGGPGRAPSVQVGRTRQGGAGESLTTFAMVVGLFTVFAAAAAIKALVDLNAGTGGWDDVAVTAAATVLGAGTLLVRHHIRRGRRPQQGVRVSAVPRSASNRGYGRTRTGG